MPDPEYGWRGLPVARQVMQQGSGVAAMFWAMFGELKFTPTSATLGVREFKATEKGEPRVFTVPFGAGVLLFRVDEDAHVIEFLDVAWLM